MGTNEIQQTHMKKRLRKKIAKKEFLLYFGSDSSGLLVTEDQYVTEILRRFIEKWSDDKN